VVRRGVDVLPSASPAQSDSVVGLAPAMVTDVKRMLSRLPNSRLAMRDRALLLLLASAGAFYPGVSGTSRPTLPRYFIVCVLPTRYR
jgi:hypothetical protein